MQLFTYKGAPIRLSTETFQARRDWHEISNVMKSKDLQLKLLYPARLSFKIEGEIRSFTDKKKLKELVCEQQINNETDIKGLSLRRRRRRRRQRRIRRGEGEEGEK